MDTRVAIAVSHIKVAIGSRNHFGGLVEWTCRPEHATAVLVASRVRRLTALANQLQRLAVEGVLQDDMVVAVGQVRDIVFDIEAVRIGDSALAP